MSIIQQLFVHNLLFQFVFIITAALYARLRVVTGWVDRRMRDRTPEEQRAALLYPFVGTITGLVAAYGLTRLSNDALTGIVVIDLAILWGFAGGFVMLMPPKRLGRVDTWERTARSLLRADWGAVTAKQRDDAAREARVLQEVAERLYRRLAGADFVLWLVRHPTLRATMLISLTLSAAAILDRIPVLVTGRHPEPMRLAVGLAVVLAGGLLMPLAAGAAHQAHLRHRQRVFATIGYEARWAGQRIARRAKPMKYEIQSGLRSPSGDSYLEAILDQPARALPQRRALASLAAMWRTLLGPVGPSASDALAIHADQRGTKPQRSG